MYNKTIRIFTVFLMLLFLFVEVMAEGTVNKKPNRLSKTNGTPSKTHFNINNISTWIYDNGDSDIQPNGNSGFIFPKGSNKAAVFESGFLWGAKINGQVRVGGSTYNQGLLPGRILANGQREDDNLPGVRIYRVRKDWETGNLSAEVNDGEGTEAEIREQYKKDWNEWPADWGAPFEDVDGNGQYDPNVDIPGVPGADQTIWFVANDLDPATTQNLYGSDPMGIEYQATFWGYASQTALGNVMFRKYKLINKSSDTFEDMYVSMWSDEDLGDAGDDYAGCDIDLSLMFVYNGVAVDPVYGDTPPAVGFDFFQGPIIPGDPTDQAIFNNKVRTGFKNLPMTAHYFFINGDPVFNDPDLGDYTNGTLQFYNLFQGLISTTGQPFTDPNTGLATKFALSGDPITGKGWVDGQLHPPGDRRQGMASGPFTMAPGDTQEVVVAELVAGDFGNVDRLGAVGLLKFYDQEAQNAYDNFFKIPSSPDAPVVAASEFDGKVVLKWDQDSESVNKIESHKDGSYSFQGYVVYQFPSKDASFQDAKIVATYDLDDGLGKVIGPAFDADAGVVLPKVLKFGSDSGIKRYITINKDLFKAGAPLNDGTKYYFAVTSYSVSSKADAVPLVLESKVNKVVVVPQTPPPGVRLQGEIGEGLTVTHEGTGDATVKSVVVDPSATTGDDYVVGFKYQHYYLDSDGKWKETNFPDSIGKSLAKTKDISPAYLTGISFIASATTRDLKFTVKDLELAPDYSYCDGIKLTFPPGIEILSAEPSGNAGTTPAVIDLAANTVTWGANDTTQNGPFHGGELLTVTVNTPTLPLDVDYLMWDDGWGFLSGPSYGINGEIKNAVGTVTISKETNYFRTENQWYVKNTTTNQVVLDKQRVYNGTNIYADFWKVPANVGANASPIVDGFQVTVDGSFDPPVQLGSVNTDDAKGTYDIDDYSFYGWAPTGRAIDAFGNGTSSIDQLQKDYELRFTGEYEAPDANGVVYVKEGTGSMATLIGARGYSLADHPMNPNPGTDAPFLVRIPFEVWNIDDNRQVNLLIYDRKQSLTDNPFYAFNPNDRMYAYINNTAYAPTVVNSGDPSNSDTDSLTWNLIFWTTDWQNGDIVKLNYDNPLQIGKDAFMFTAPKVTKDLAAEKADVEKINVFPNPYYGVNPNEINKYQRFVTFNHLPQKAVIRVFNLAGQLIKTINKDNSDQFEKWDLKNQSGLPAASGLYIVHIDMPDLGKTKILKVAIIQETQILDRF